MTPLSRELVQYWYLALGEPVGIWLRHPEVDRLKQALYRARVDAADPALAGIQVRTSVTDPGNELWLVNAGAAPLTNGAAGQ